MTPDQTTELVKALNQHNWFLVACGIIWLLGTILQFLVVTRIKSAIENKQHFSRVRYEREIEIYLQIWKKCFLLCEAVERLPIHDSSHSGLQHSETQVCIDAQSTLVLAIRDHRPFFPHEIWKELKLFQKLCYELYSIKQSPSLSVSKGNALEALPEQIDSQLEKVEEAIRSRLDKFDGS